jgi:NADPH-dependent ferric siderophore reductase
MDAAAPFRFADLCVVRTERLGPTMVRVTLGGAELARLASGGRDQRVKLFLPHPGQDVPVVPRGEDWYAEWRAMDPEVRAIMRTYTVREQRPGPGKPNAPDALGELDIDFALHGDGGGPASRWAARARAGDRVALLGPIRPDNGGVDFRPPPGSEWMLITADEASLPAVAGILAWLPAGAQARVWIEVPYAADLQELPTEATAEITWLVRGGSRSPGRAVLDAVRSADLPDGTPYAWIAGEARAAGELRRHLLDERGFDRKAVTFTGYWRLGATEEQLLATHAGSGVPATARPRPRPRPAVS